MCFKSNTPVKIKTTFLFRVFDKDIKWLSDLIGNHRLVHLIESTSKAHSI